MTDQVDPSATNISELLEVAAILVCKGYAQGTRKALFLACKEIYGSTETPKSTYQLCHDTFTIMRVIGVVTEGALVFKGGFGGGYSKFWLDDQSRELLLMSFIWAKTYVDAEMVPARDDVQ